MQPRSVLSALACATALLASPAFALTPLPASHVSDAEGLAHFPPGCRCVLLKVHLDWPPFLDAFLQERRLVPERPTFNGKFLVVGDQTQRLPGLHLLSKIDFEFLHLERRWRIAPRTGPTLDEVLDRRDRRVT